MQSLLIAFAVFVLIRFAERKLRNQPTETLGVAIRREAAAGAIAAAALGGIFALLFVFAVIFGPIPPLHEW